MKSTFSALFVSLLICPACGESQLEGKPQALVEELQPPEVPLSKPEQVQDAKPVEGHAESAGGLEATKPERIKTSAATLRGRAATEKPSPKQDAPPRDDEERDIVLDSSRSTVAFVGRKVTKDHEGSFSGLSGSGTLKGYLPRQFKVSIEMDTLTSDHPKLTNHLKSADFFNSAKYPQARFVTTKIRPGGEGSATHTMSGELSLLAVTKRITFPATIVVTDAGATGVAEFTINRKDFGIMYPGRPDDLIADKVLLKLNLAFLDKKYVK